MLISAGLELMLGRIEEVQLVTVLDDPAQTSESLKKYPVSLLFYVIAEPHDAHFAQIGEIRRQFPGTRILVAALKATKEAVFKAIRSGANGLIAGDVTFSELQKAVFTLRSGHEFFSSSITNLLVTDYVDALRSQASPVRDIDKLSKRELEILTLWGEGSSNKEIADKLFVSVRTVETHKNHIMQKLRIRSTVDLIKFAIRNNLIAL